MVSASFLELKKYACEKAYLIGAGNNSRKVALLLILAFDNRLDDTRVVRAQVHKDVCYAGAP